MKNISSFQFILFVFMTLFSYSSIAFELISLGVKGNTKTKSYIVINESDLVVGEDVDKKQVREAVTRIKNLNLFSEVRAIIAPITKEKKRVIFEVKERWTTIPILKFSSGGGVTEVIGGIFDPNLFGRFIEAGFQFQRLAGENSGVAWLKLPRLSKKWGLDIQVWDFNRLRIKYDQDEDDPIAEQGFIQNRQRLYFGLTYRPNYEISNTFYYEYNGDTFSGDIELDDFQDLPDVPLPPESNAHILGFTSRIGREDFHDELVNTSLLEVDLNYAFVQDNPASDFYRLNARYSYAKSFRGRHNFAQRILAGSTNTELIQYLNYLGGFDRIRGFADNRFSGGHFWLSNSEYRYSLLKSASYTLQTVGFLDIGSTQDQVENLFSISGASVGIGARVFLPKFYRFVLRFDIAQPVISNDDNSFSFGVQQFF